MLSFFEEFYINAPLELHKSAFLTTLQQFLESRCYGCRVRGNYVQQQLLLFTHRAFFLQDLVHNKSVEIYDNILADCWWNLSTIAPSYCHLFLRKIKGCQLQIEDLIQYFCTMWESSKSLISKKQRFFCAPGSLPPPWNQQTFTQIIALIQLKLTTEVT